MKPEFYLQPSKKRIVVVLCTSGYFLKVWNCDGVQTVDANLSEDAADAIATILAEEVEAMPK